MHHLSINIKKDLQTAEGKFPLSVNLSVQKGEFLALTGPSGSGKTTLLRLIAGLEKLATGTIILNKETWLDTKNRQFLVPQKRSIGFVFQDYALFPNMTIQENLAFGVNQNTPKNRVGELMDLIDLTMLGNRYPHQLSGGQQQRVALARALVRQPQILLLDEPLSALDTMMRQRLQDDLKRLHEAYQLTTILVSHDEREIAKLANRVVVLELGKIIAAGKPAEVLKNDSISVLVSAILKEGEMVKLICKEGGEEIVLTLPSKMAMKYRVGDRVVIS